LFDHSDGDIYLRVVGSPTPRRELVGDLSQHYLLECPRVSGDLLGEVKFQARREFEDCGLQCVLLVEINFGRAWILEQIGTVILNFEVCKYLI